MDLNRIRGHLPWITLLALTGIIGVAEPAFLRPANLLSLAGDIVPLFIMALGLTFAIYIGGIDLSCQPMANMITVIASNCLAPLGGLGGAALHPRGLLPRDRCGLRHPPALRPLLHLDPWRSGASASPSRNGSRATAP